MSPCRPPIPGVYFAYVTPDGTTWTAYKSEIEARAAVIRHGGGTYRPVSAADVAVKVAESTVWRVWRVLMVRCPYCGVGVGAECRTKSGREASQFHSARRNMVEGPR